MVVLGGVAVSNERGTPVAGQMCGRQTWAKWLLLRIFPQFSPNSATPSRAASSSRTVHGRSLLSACGSGRGAAFAGGEVPTAMGDPRMILSSCGLCGTRSNIALGGPTPIPCACRGASPTRTPARIEPAGAEAASAEAAYGPMLQIAFGSEGGTAGWTASGTLQLERPLSVTVAADNKGAREELLETSGRDGD